MAQRKAEEKQDDMVEFMNSVLHDLEKMEKSLGKLTNLTVANQTKLADLEARIQTIESIPLLASHIRTINATPAS
jgi:archaellum component FlaC